MSARISPIAMIVIQGDRVRLVSVREQDIWSRLLDSIPDAISRIKGGSMSEDAKAKASEALDNMNAETIKDIELIKEEQD